MTGDLEDAPLRPMPGSLVAEEPLLSSAVMAPLPSMKIVESIHRCLLGGTDRE